MGAHPKVMQLCPWLEVFSLAWSAPAAFPNSNKIIDTYKIVVSFYLLLCWHITKLGACPGYHCISFTVDTSELPHYPVAYFFDGDVHMQLWTWVEFSVSSCSSCLSAPCVTRSSWPWAVWSSCVRKTYSCLLKHLFWPSFTSHVSILSFLPYLSIKLLPLPLKSLYHFTGEPSVRM